MWTKHWEQNLKESEAQGAHSKESNYIFRNGSVKHKTELHLTVLNEHISVCNSVPLRRLFNEQGHFGIKSLILFLHFQDAHGIVDEKKTYLSSMICLLLCIISCYQFWWKSIFNRKLLFFIRIWNQAKQFLQLNFQKDPFQQAIDFFCCVSNFCDSNCPWEFFQID